MAEEKGRIFQKIGRPVQQRPVRQRPVQNFIKGIEEMAAQRLAICHNCSHWDARFRRCKACGCFTSAKARLPHAKCPKGFWGRADR